MGKAFQDYSENARKLLIAAERLIGKHGIEGVSLRQINAAAGHANNSAAQYHFGSKDGLIIAAYEMRLPLLDSVRRDWFEEIEARRQPGLEDLLAALLLPIVDSLKEPVRTTFAMFGLRTLDSNLSERFGSESFSPTLGLINSTLRASLPELPDEIYSIRYRMAIRLFLNGFLEQKRQHHVEPALPIDVELFWDEIFQAAVSVFRGPFPANPRPKREPV